MTYFGYFLYTSILRCHEMRKKKHQIRQREGVWSGTQAGEERPVYPKTPG